MKHILLLTFLFTAAPMQAAISYRFTTTTTGAHSSTMSGRVTADGPRMRVDFDRGDRMVFKDSSVAISSDGGKTLVLLDPATHTYATLKLDAMLGDASAMLSFTAPKISTRDLGDGGPLEGYPDAPLHARRLVRRRLRRRHAKDGGHEHHPAQRSVADHAHRRRERRVPAAPRPPPRQPGSR